MSNNKNNKFVKPNQDYMPDGDSAMLQKSIDELGLSEFTSSKLKAVEIEKIIDLCRCQMRHMYKIPGMNKKSVFEVLKKMQNVGLDFKRSPVAATTMEEVEKQPNQTANVAANANAKAKNNKDNKKGFKDNKNRDNKDIKDKENKDTKADKDNKKANFEGKQKPENKQNPNQNQKDKPAQKNKNDKKSDNIPQNKMSNNKEERRQNNQPQKNFSPQNEQPKRMKVNSYELDAFINDNESSKKTLKQEREEKIAKAIKDLPAIKNPDGLYKFYRHGKWGYKTENGKVIIEPTYSEAFNFKEGLACVELNERCGFINKQGEVVIPIQYDTACSFSEGLASVTKDDKCGYIDKEGNIVFEFVYDAATSFENDIALVKKDGKWGYMDRKTGEIRLR